MMRRPISRGAAFVLLALGVTAGCGKKETPPTAPGEYVPTGAVPAGDPRPGPVPGGIPPDRFPYDPLKPEIKINLAKFAQEVGWSMNGRSRSGVMIDISVNLIPAGVVQVRDEFGEHTIP